MAAQFGVYAISAPAGAAESDTVFARGAASYLGSPFFPPDKPTVGIESTPSGNGYFVLNSRGRVTTKGDAGWFGDMGFATLNQPIVAMAVTTTGNGYWLLSKDGGIFAFGNAQFFGSTGGQGLGDAVDIVASPQGGYWIALASGVVRHFNAPDLPDASGQTSSRFVGLARSGTGNGYWQLTEDGDVFASGDAPAFLPATDEGAGKVFTSIAARPDGGGYWLLAKDGTISNYGSAAPFDAVSSPFAMVAVAAHPSSNGLWAASSAMPGPGAIQGVVKNQDGAGVGGVCVSATSSDYTARIASAVTSVTGFYRLSNVNAGPYRVKFEDCSNDTYYTKWFDDADNEADADIVNVQADKTTFQVGATMEPGGFISGSVRDDKGDPAYSCVVVADRETGAGGSYNTVTGAYKAGPLKPGSYKVTFTACGSNHKVSQTWPAADFPAYGQEIDVDEGGHVRNISGVLRTPGAITGTVTDFGGSPLGQVCVQASIPNEENRSGNQIGVGFSSVTGFYRIDGLRTGAYAVRFSDCGGRGLAEEHYDDAVTEPEADAVHVQNGLTTSGIDASMMTGAAISGSVQSGDGPVAYACVSAWRDGSQFPAATAYSTVTGFYRIAGLQQGSYRVHFNPCWASGDYAPEWWQNSATREGATPLSLTPMAEAGEINGTFSGPSSSISGVVKKVNGDTAPGACVTAKDSGGITKQAFTTVTGFYRITGLGAQAYKVRFEPCNGLAGAPEWFNNKANEVAANPVVTSPGANTPNINARFDRAGSISGVVTAGGEAARPCITLTDTAGNVVVEGLPSSITGFYKIDRLHGGNYKLKFSECDPGPYEKEWWNNADSAATASVIGVAAGDNTTVDGDLALESANAPTGVTATAGNSSATVSWTPPSYAGTSPTTAYEVSAWAGGFPVKTVTVSSSQTNAVVTGLQNNKQYRFRVAARNAGGLGRQSALSNAVTPRLTAQIATPGTVNAPAVVTFSDIVKGVTTSNLVIRQTGSGSNLPAAVACKNQGGTIVSCASGLVRTAELQPTAPLTGGVSYTVVVNPAGVPPIRDFAGNIVTRTSASFEAGSAAAGVSRV